MNPYFTFSDLLFTVVDAPKAETVNIMLAGFNEPEPSDVERALMAGAKEVQVFENGVCKIYRPGDPLPSKDIPIQYFAREVAFDLSLAYVNHAERDTRKPQRVIFWEPKIHPGTTVCMGVFHDGLSHSIWCMSADSPDRWINVRVYDDPDYPRVFLRLLRRPQDGTAKAHGVQGRRGMGLCTGRADSAFREPRLL